MLQDVIGKLLIHVSVDRAPGAASLGEAAERRVLRRRGKGKGHDLAGEKAACLRAMAGEDCGSRWKRETARSCAAAKNARGDSRF